MAEIITSRQNQWVRRLAEARRGKGPWGAFCLPEGLKLCTEARLAGLETEAVFAAEGREAEAMLFGGPDTPRFILSDELFRKVADTVNPQGLLMVCAKPEVRPLRALTVPETGVFSLLVLENIQDPGNLGTMIRTAQALGWDAAVMTEGSADPFQAKAMRASMGMSFRLPLYRENQSHKIIEYCREKGLRIVTAALDGEPLPGFRRTGNLSLWIGNEGQGLSETSLAAADVRLTIPMPGGAESLNAAAAAAILMYRLQEGSGKGGL